MAAAEVIRSFLSDLVFTISDYVLQVSDCCLAEGLIPNSVYKRVLETGGTNEDKARALILAVNRTIETDSRNLEILLNILQGVLPYQISNRLLSAIRREIPITVDTHRAVIPSLQTIPAVYVHADQSGSLFSRHEDPTRQLKQASTQNNILLEMLKAKSKECDRLTDELEAFKKQTQEAAPDANARRRITACEHEISALKLRVEELEGTLVGQNKQENRGLIAARLKN